MKLQFILFILFSLPFFSQAQENYPLAYNEIKKMLSNEEKVSFKKAVFLVENAFFEGQLDSAEFNGHIRFLASLSKSYSKANSLMNYSEKDREKVLLWGSVFKTLSDTVEIQLQDGQIAQHLPFTYDFEDPFGDQDWTKMFVTKLLATHTGNCHSLPYLYKIVCEELGVSANLALAPNHTYIKHHSEKTGWYNTELTSAAFPIDSWLMASGFIHLSALQNQVYMKALTDEESLSLCLVDLAEGYKRKTNLQDPDFVLKCCNTALDYFPNNVNALILKAETLKHIAQKTNSQETLMQAQELYLKIHDLGFRQMPKIMYLEWLTSLKTEGDKYLNKAFGQE
jgi:hypothetical protein